MSKPLILVIQLGALVAIIGATADAPPIDWGTITIALVVGGLAGVAWRKREG